MQMSEFTLGGDLLIHVVLYLFQEFRVINYCRGVFLIGLISFVSFIYFYSAIHSCPHAFL